MAGGGRGASLSGARGVAAEQHAVRDARRRRSAWAGTVANPKATPLSPPFSISGAASAPHLLYSSRCAWCGSPAAEAKPAACAWRTACAAGLAARDSARRSIALLRCPGGRPAPCALTGATLALPRTQRPCRKKDWRHRRNPCRARRGERSGKRLGPVPSRIRGQTTAKYFPSEAGTAHQHRQQLQRHRLSRRFLFLWLFFLKASCVIDDVGMMAGSCRRVACAARRSIRPLLFDLAAAARAPSRQRARARARATSQLLGAAHAL